MPDTLQFVKESHNGSLLTLVLAAWLVVTVYIYRLHRRYAHIPSPKMPSFYLGHLPIIVEATKDETPVFGLILKWCQEVGPVFVWFLPHRAIIFTMTPDDIKELCRPAIKKDPFLYSRLSSVFGERFVGHGLVTIRDYDTWKSRRRLYDPAFTKSFLKSLVPVFNECVDQFLEKLRPLADGQTQVPMKDEFSSITLHIISRVAFGANFTKVWTDLPLGLKHAKPGSRTLQLPFLIMHTVRGIETSIQSPLHKYTHPNETESYRETARAIRMIGKDCIERRIRATENGEKVPNDVLSRILERTTIEENISIEDLVDDFVTFYGAGQETTANLLSFILVQLHEHPDVQERVVSEVREVLGERETVSVEDLDQLKYTEQVIQETMRLYPPANGLNKQAPKGFKLSGYDIPEGTAIVVSSYVNCRMAENFEDPMTFDPNRFDPNRSKPNRFVYFPFGLGHRYCIGKTFAMMEAKIILSRLLQSYSISLPRDYQFLTVQRTTLQIKDSLLCTLELASCM